MTGTTRAALRLALGVLRASAGTDAAWLFFACDVLDRGPGGAGLGAAALAACRSRRETDSAPLAWRLARARLALYLRAVLRAERGDFGTRCCGVCRGPLRRDVGCEAPLWGLGWCARHKVQHSDPAPNRASIAVPLWSQAPGRKP